MQLHGDTLPLTPCSLPVPQDPIPPPPVALHYQEEAGNPRAGLTQQPNPSVLGRAVSPLCPPPQQWLCHSHHPVEAPGQQLPAAPQGLPHAQGLVSGTHGALQGKGRCQGLCQPQGTASTVPGAALAPWHTHPPWLRCSRPPRPPWARTWGTPAPLQRQAGSRGFVPGCGCGQLPPARQTLWPLRISASMLEAQCSPPRSSGSVDEGGNSLQGPVWHVAVEHQHRAGGN